MANFGAGEQEVCGEHTEWIVMLMSIPKVFKKGMLSAVFDGSDMTAQMQVLRTNTCL